MSTLKMGLPRDWILFERMRLAQAQNDCGQRTDFALLQQQRQLHSFRRIEIDSTHFKAETLIAAIKQLTEAGGGQIYLPSGTLELRTELQLSDGLRLIGQPEQTNLVFKDVDYGIKMQGTEGNPLKNISVSNLRIFHQGDHKFCAAILATHTVGLNLANIDIISPRAVGVLLADSVKRTTLLNCKVEHAGLVGFMLVRSVTETIMKGCIAEWCQQSGVFLTDLKLPEGITPLDFHSQLDYTNNVIGNYGPFHAEDPGPYRTEINNCIFRHNRKMGITTDGVGYLSVRNTVIAYNDCEGITIDNGSWGCQIQNCHIYSNGWRGNQHEIELGDDFVKEMGLMMDGSSKAKLPGISLDNAALTRIENNHIECNWGDGIKMVRAVHASTIANNLIGHNNRGVNDRFHYFGVLIGVAARQHPEQDDFPSTDNKVLNNDILGQHYAGIHLMLGVSGNIIQYNRIEGSTYEAIEDHEKINDKIAPQVRHRLSLTSRLRTLMARTLNSYGKKG